LGKFWSSNADSDEGIESPTTPEFIEIAMKAGFTEEELTEAENQLSSSKVAS
jgi:hypothetical protein